MIELYRRVESEEGDRLETVLKRLRAAHKVVIHDDKTLLPLTLPAIKDSGKWYSGEDTIAGYLDELEELLARWTWFTADACYIDDDGELC